MRWQSGAQGPAEYRYRQAMQRLATIGDRVAARCCSRNGLTPSHTAPATGPRHASRPPAPQSLTKLPMSSTASGMPNVAVQAQDCSRVTTARYSCKTWRLKRTGSGLSRRSSARVLFHDRAQKRVATKTRCRRTCRNSASGVVVQLFAACREIRWPRPRVVNWQQLVD